MVLSEILFAGGQSREGWMTVGSRMIAVDTLVHNFLHRTGILAVFGFDHNYGSACYGSSGCEAAIGALSVEINPQAINPDYPRHFPRWVQFAIWRFCTEGEFNICNGRQIDDRLACARTDCILGDRCSRVPLFPEETIFVELEP